MPEIEKPRTPEAVMLILILKDLIQATNRLRSLGRCPAAVGLIEQAEVSVEVAYRVEQGDAF